MEQRITKQCGHLCHGARTQSNIVRNTSFANDSFTYVATKLILLAFFELLCVIQNNGTNFVSLIAFRHFFNIFQIILFIHQVAQYELDFTLFNLLISELGTL